MQTLKLANEFNRYFTSSNDVDVPAKVQVPRDEWRELYKSIKNLQATHAELQRRYSWYSLQQSELFEKTHRLESLNK